MARDSIHRTVLTTLATTLSHGCILAQVIILTRALGPEGYGIFAFAITLQSYLFLFSCVGVRPVVVREASQCPHDLDRVLTAHLVLTASVAGLLALLVLATTAFIPIASRERVLLGLLAIGNIPASVNLLPLFDAHHRQPRSAAMTLVSEATALLALIYLYHCGQADLAMVGAVFVGKWAVNAGMHGLVYYRWIRPIRLVFDKGYLGKMARSSWPLMLAALLATTPFSVGVFFVRLLRDSAEAGIMGLGQQAASAYLLLAAVGVRIAQPYLAGARAGQRGILKRLTILYGIFVGLLFCAFLGGAFIVVRWMLDAPYQEALTPMILLLAAAFVQSLGAFSGAYLIVRRDEMIVLAAHGCAALFYLLACWWAVPLAGATGAALLSVCAAGIATGVLAARLVEHPAALSPPSPGVGQEETEHADGLLSEGAIHSEGRA